MPSICLLWTDNTSTASWTKQVAGLNGPQGKALTQIFAHFLLMFSNVGINADHLSGHLNQFPFPYPWKQQLLTIFILIPCTKIPSVERLPSLPSQSRIALAHLFGAVHQLAKHSHNKSQARTAISWVTQWTHFCTIFQIVDSLLLHVELYWEVNEIFTM